jgi:hypothetical protein
VVAAGAMEDLGQPTEEENTGNYLGRRMMKPTCLDSSQRHLWQTGISLSLSLESFISRFWRQTWGHLDLPWQRMRQSTVSIHVMPNAGFLIRSIADSLVGFSSFSL